MVVAKCLEAAKVWWGSEGAEQTEGVVSAPPLPLPSGSFDFPISLSSPLLYLPQAVQYILTAFLALLVFLLRFSSCHLLTLAVCKARPGYWGAGTKEGASQAICEVEATG